MTRSPYSVPSMTEIDALDWNGYTVASTFSGAGGSSLGYRMAGFRVAYANEFVEAARDTYSANSPTTQVDGRDIRIVTGSEILLACGVKRGELDILDGSPPCVAFSTAGRGAKTWGQSKSYSDTEQRVDDLFDEYIRLISEVKPRTFVAENVPGLVKGKAKGYFKRIHAAMTALGYMVSARLFDASKFSVPQSRQRLIFIGVRKDVTNEIPRPRVSSPKPYTALDAIAGLPEATQENAHWLREGTKYYDLWHHVEPGRKFSDMATKMYGSPSKYYTHRIIDPHKPAPTVVQGTQDVYHWKEPRSLSIPELKRVSSFPDDFILTGSFAKQWERIGRAVPPLMMYAIAQSIREILDTQKVNK